MSVIAPADPFKSPDEVRCKHCGAVPRLAHKILDPRSGGTLRMYKCECGEQMWVNLPV
jgi:lysyl-tRNA synthetase class I